MNDEQVERRRRRLQAQRVLDELAVDYRDAPGVDRATMFGSEGLRVAAKFFAFVGRDGQLILKLPAARAADLVADEAAATVRVGRSVAREWVGLPFAEDRAGLDRWRILLADAHRYVAAQNPAAGATSSSRDHPGPRSGAEASG